ncbi:MAG: hypothetical protein A2X46_04280 [Lentisphaerae bacterium GWF2_57_35]|nr:MAG: hypothetical protein A2X46_04280 [Lentisphaerae bacterium GWF2_57_35]
MSVHSNTPADHCRYFVDEAGDGVLFNAKGSILIENAISPKHFILGMVQLEDERAVEADLTQLRTALLNDPYFHNVPSLNPQQKKTALLFHAKDDLPEIRREVFKLLVQHSFRFFAVIKSMQAVLDYVHSRNAMDSSYRYRPNELYDLTVRMLFKQRLHLQSKYEVVFSRRGHSDRTKALQSQLLIAQQRFFEKTGCKDPQSELMVTPANAHEYVGLQVADYCLWALQRLYERKEERFIQLLWPKVSLIHDVDDKQNRTYGSYYTKKDPPLTGEDMEKRRI